MQIYRSEERGRTELAWLDSRHTFSFGDYYDPDRMGYGPLRVVNDDRVVAGGGFPTHPHRDMEILTYVIDGAVAHRDSMGHTTTVGAGEVQLMSAGRGVTHSEFNPSKTAATRFLQVWIVPRSRGGEPRYQQQRVELEPPGAGWVLLAATGGDGGGVVVDQDVSLHATRLREDSEISLDLPSGRRGWLQVVCGSVRIDTRGEETGGDETGGGDADLVLAEGDGLAWEQVEGLALRASGRAELLRFDLP